MTSLDFKYFLVIWNQKQGQATPEIHLRMAAWLEQKWREGDLHLLLMAFRASGKSTLAGLFAAWLLYMRPELRILVLAADENLARKMVRQVRKILEKHPFTAHLKPDRPDQWSGDRFTVKRRLELRDPSMMAKGVTSNMTGSRADVVICDDVEVPNTSDTAEKRRNLRERLSEISYVLTPGGTQIYIGTPHNFHSIYASEARAELGESAPFLGGFTRLEIPLLNGSGESAWPEKFDAGAIQRMKTHTGPNKFASQMMLRPVNIAEGRLDPDRLQIYTEPLDYTRELQSLFLGPVKLVSSSAWWDPAFGKGQGDCSVLACVFLDDTGQYYLHHLEYIKLGRTEDDEATAQCKIAAQVLKDLYLPSVTIETNGIGKFLPALLRNELARAKAPCAVKEHSASRPKDLRIIEAFDALLAARRLSVHESVLQTPFMTEMREWRPGSSRGHDDGLDAVAGALSQAPLRLPRVYGAGAHAWMRGRDAHKAKTEFEV